MTFAGSVSSFNASGSSAGFFVNRLDSGTSGYQNSSDITLVNPFVAQWSSGQILGIDTATTGNFGGFAGGFVHQSAASYNGINIIASAGNISGVVSIYGVSK